jgi:hypothetical protein
MRASSFKARLPRSCRLGATDEIDLTATLIDINGNADVSGTVTATGTSVFASLDISGDIDVDGTTNLDVVDIDGAVILHLHTQEMQPLPTTPRLSSVLALTYRSIMMPQTAISATKAQVI